MTLMKENEIFEILNKECKLYLNKLKKCKKGHFLLRGYYYQLEDYKKFYPDLENRKPRNMPQDIHDEINNHFQPIFNWKIRNGVFCYGFDILNNQPVDLGYGFFYLFFPIGNFNYVYSDEHFDLFGYVNNSKLSKNELIQSLHFSDKNFCEVMNLREEYHGFGNEVSINNESYYLVNTDLTGYLTSKIWG